MNSLPALSVMAVVGERVAAGDCCGAFGRRWARSGPNETSVFLSASGAEADSRRSKRPSRSVIRSPPNVRARWGEG